MSCSPYGFTIFQSRIGIGSILPEHWAALTQLENSKNRIRRCSPYGFTKFPISNSKFFHTKFLTNQIALTEKPISEKKPLVLIGQKIRESPDSGFQSLGIREIMWWEVQ